MNTYCNHHESFTWLHARRPKMFVGLTAHLSIKCQEGAPVWLRRYVCTYYIASVKQYPTNDPLEGFCFNSKAGGKLTQQKKRTFAWTKQCKQTQPITNQQRLFNEKCKAKRRKSVAPAAKKMKIPKVRSGQERHAWRKRGLSPGVGGPEMKGNPLKNQRLHPPLFFVK